jgi:hypothetical protein
MDQSIPKERPSGIPRPSRLPVPRASVRPSPSRENLQQSKLGISNPRLRNTPSREQLSASTSTRRTSSTPLRSQGSSLQLRGRDASSYNPGPALRNGSGNSISKKPSRALLNEESNNIGGQDSADQEPGTEEYPIASKESHRKPRPSLSERAMDTLQNIPSSPAIRKRTSSFFNPESPMRPPSSGTQSSRPGSSYDTSMRPPSRTVSSRPASRAGQSNQSIPVRTFSHIVSFCC